ncbi:gamma-glutamyltransferase [Ferrimonas gelatinilytica]|uniref:Glutathione hydrolase proenzyme n=1 Tax=Ferrimonas gelatinilytica TaxID=1255257 RepID=A0ABP9RZE5_9GAMM
MTMTRFTAFFLFGLCSAVVLAQGEPEGDTGFTHTGVARGQDFMAATANPYATEAAAVILADGGSAVDAVIAAQMVLTLTEPQSSGIGGGLFLLHWDAKNAQLLSLDGREAAPAAASPTLFVGNRGEPVPWIEAVVGGRSVGVPGAVAALYEAHRRFGVLPWSQLLGPAITLAEEGFEVSPRLALLLAQEINPGLRRPGKARGYFAPGGEWLTAGDRRENPALARTLRRLATEGPDAFYRGELAEQIVDAVQSDPDRPGLLSLADLADYRPRWRSPVCQPYRQYQVCGMGPPSSGGITVGQILSLLEPYPVSSWTPQSPEFVHRFSQASRLAYADRARYIADDAFYPVPVQTLLSETYLNDRRRLMGSDRDMGPAAAGKLPVQAGPDTTRALPSTTHLVMVDAEGNMVSMTSSIEMGFGSTVMVGGFLLNNQLTDFALDPGTESNPAANRVEAGKRPRSSMAPTLVLDAEGQPNLAIGSPGGSRIISYVSQMLIALLDWQLPLEQALALPRISHRNDNLVLEAERTSPELAAAMEARGYDVRLAPLNSGVQVIRRSVEGWEGAADPRREGTAIGGTIRSAGEPSH